MTKFKIGDKVLLADDSLRGEYEIVDIRDTGSKYDERKAYIVAFDEGHGEWSLSEELNSEEEVLKRLVSYGSSKYRVFTEVKVELKVKE